MRAATLLSLLAALTLVACDSLFGAEPEPKPPRPTEAEWPRVDVAPNELRVARVGVPLTIEARVTDLEGEPMADYPWEWRYEAGQDVEAQAESPEPGVERLTVTLHRASPRVGDAYVEETFTAIVRMCDESNVHDCVRRFPVVVHAWGGPAAELRLSDESMTLVPGEARPVTAMAWAAGSHPSDDVVTFESDAPGVATVDGLGVVRGVAQGQARVIARAGGAEAEVLVTVEAGAPYVPAFEEATLMPDLPERLVFHLVEDMEEIAVMTARGPVLAGWLDPDGDVRIRPVAVIREWTGTGWSTERVSEPFERPEEVRVALDGLGTLYVLYRDALRGLPVVAWRATGEDATPGAWERAVLEIVPRPVAVELQSRQELWVLDRERADPRERLSVLGRPEGGAWVSYLEVSAQFPCYAAHFLGTVSPGPPDPQTDPIAIDVATFCSCGTCFSLDPDIPGIDERTVLADGVGVSPVLGASRVPHWRSNEQAPSTFRGGALPGFVDDSGVAELSGTVAVATVGSRRYLFGADRHQVDVVDVLGGVYRDELLGLGVLDPRAVLADLPRVYFLGSEGDAWWWSSVELPAGATFAAGRGDDSAGETGPNGPWRLTVTPGTPLDLAALPGGGLVAAQSGFGHEWASFLTYRADAPGDAFEAWGAGERHWTPEPAGPLAVVDGALFVAAWGAFFRSDDDGASWWLHGSMPHWPDEDVYAEQAALPDGRAVVVLGRRRGADWELEPWVADDLRAPTAFWRGPAVAVEEVAEPAGEEGVTRGTRAVAWPVAPGEGALTLVVGFSTPPELWTLGFGEAGLEVLERRAIAAPDEAGNKVLWASRGLLASDGAFWTFAQNAGDITSTRPLLRVDLGTAEASAVALPEAFHAEPFIEADMAQPPVLVELADGRILVAAAVPVEDRGAYARTRAVYVTTSDGGASWTAPVELMPEGGNGQVVYDAAVPAAGGVVFLLGDNAALSTSPRARAWPPAVGSLPGGPPPMAPLFMDLPSP